MEDFMEVALNKAICMIWFHHTDNTFVTWPHGLEKLSLPRDTFIVTAFQLCFRICHQESSGKPGGTENNGTHQLLIYADNANLLTANTDTIKKNTEPLIDASAKVGPEVNAEKTKYMLLPHHQYAGQNHDIKIANRSFENVAQFKYLGMTVTNQNLIHEEIRRRMNLGNACYHSVQSLLSSHLLSKSIKIRIYKTMILPVVLYGCEIWSLTLRNID
jgi:hypothetical protein